MYKTFLKNKYSNIAFVACGTYLIGKVERYLTPI